MQNKESKTKIKAIRTYFGYSQVQFAKMFSVDQTAVSNWERGQNNIDIKTLQRIAEHFNVPVEYILGKEYEIRKPMSEWHESELEDYYGTSDEGRDYVKFKVGKGYFPSIDHDTDTESDDELTDLLETLRSRPEMRMLFSTLKSATAEDIELTRDIIEKLKSRNNG